MSYTIANGFRFVFVAPIIMVRAKLVSYRVVSLPGLSPVWKITNPEDVVEVGDKVFVKLSPANTGLRSLVCAG